MKDDDDKDSEATGAMKGEEELDHGGPKLGSKEGWLKKCSIEDLSLLSNVCTANSEDSVTFIGAGFDKEGGQD